MSACVAALAARELGLIAAAGALALAAVITALARRPGPWLCAVPAALAAAAAPPAPAPAPWPRPGPVWIEATVRPGIERDLAAGELRMRLQTRSGQVVRAFVHGDLEVLPGDTVRGAAVAPAQSAPEAAPWIATEAGALEVATGPPGLGRAADRCRLAMQAALLAAVEGEEGALLCHLVLGRGPALPDDLVAAHRATGLSHLLAISGAHASMLAWMLAALYSASRGRSALGSRRYRWLCVVLLLGYGLLTGMEPPVFRALAAWLLVLWAHAHGRRAGPVAVLALPALLTAVLAPADLLSASFNLSYAAVCGLALAGFLRGDTWRDRRLLAPLLASLWATLLTTPLTLLYFGQVAPWTIVATPLLAPLVGVLLAGGLLVAGLGLVAPALAGALGPALGSATALYCEAVRATAELPGTPILATCRADPAVLAGIAVLAGALVAARPRRTTVVVGCVLLALPHFAGPRPTEPGLTLLRVGHGQACLARTPGGYRVLVDCGQLGDARGAAVAAARALEPDTALDLLVLTHPHHDHAGGALALSRRVRIARVALPAEMVGGAIARALAAAGAVLQPLGPGETCKPLPGIALARPRTRSEEPNDDSIWVRIDLGTCVALLTGDALEAAVDAWLASPWCAPADILVLPHHGRAHARAADLLEAVQPALALVSNAPGRGWTAQSAIARGLGIRVLETGRVGTIEIDPGPPVVVRTERPLRLR